MDENKLIAEAFKASEKEFKNLHKGDWHYDIESETVVDGEIKKSVSSFIKVGLYGLDDIQYVEEDGKIFCNYTEPCDKFDTLEQAYLFHNKLWTLFDEKECE